MKPLTFRLKQGQFLKEEIEARTKGVEAGVLLSVVAGLEVAVLRMAGATPEHQEIKRFKGPLEVVSATGTISSDGCHIHISVSDADGNVVGGHLKDGCVVAFTAEVVIGILEGTTFRRIPDAETGYEELTVS